jgi:hypothetical protein
MTQRVAAVATTSISPETAPNWRPGSATASLAAALMALFLGMRVLARTQRPPEALTATLRQLDTMLETALGG